MASTDTPIHDQPGLARDSGDAAPSRWRNAVPGFGLFVAYWLLSLLNSPAGFLGTDTGGKVATLKAMADNGTFTNLDVGYWAARWDPNGLLHPLYNSVQHGDQWIQVTTLPMLLLGEPLYRLGGYRLTLLLPMLGAVACAYAARALARRLGADTKRQWWAFWIIGLASPVAIYALDFWEHTIGLALMAWGTIALVGLLDTDETRRRIWLCGLGGLAFGAAATMRTEALIYLAVTAGVVAVTVLVKDRRIMPWLLPGCALVAGAIVPLAGNLGLSRVIIGGGLREGRTAGAAGGFGSSLPLRLREGLTTTFGLTSDSSTSTILIGVLSAALITFATVRASREGPPASPVTISALGSCIALLYLVMFANGLGFVAGLTGAAPLAIVGVATMWRPGHNRAARTATIAALAAIPLVWAFQWTGGAGPQWGGRYMLCSMLILVTVAVTTLPRLRKPLPVALTGLSIAVTVFGLAWLSVRTHDVARTFDTLNARPEPVLIADVGMQFVPREGGATYGAKRWLIANDPHDRAAAAQVVQHAGLTSFALIELTPSSPPRTIGAFVRTKTDEIRWFQGVTLAVTTYELTGT